MKKSRSDIIKRIVFLLVGLFLLLVLYELILKMFE